MKVSDSDETMDHIMSECSKLAQKYESMYDWIRRVIDKE